MQIKILRDDHQQLLNLCRQLETASTYASNSREIESILLLLAKLAGKLNDHLIREDEHLYPCLMLQGQSEVADMASRLQAELGDLQQRVGGYIDRWDGESASHDRIRFITELCDLIGAVRARIRKEEALLFPMISD